MKRDEFILLLIFLLYVQAYLFQNVFPALVAFSLLFYLLCLRIEFSSKIKVEKEINKNLVENKKSKITLKFKNNTKKSFKIEIIDLLPPGFKSEKVQPFVLENKETRKIEYSLIPQKGIYVFEGPRIRVIEPREIYYEEIMAKPKLKIEVYPSLEQIKDELKSTRAIKMAQSLRKTTGLKTVELDVLRKYQIGDELRYIDWKATARIGELIVKEFLREGERDIYIILDCGQEMRKGIVQSKIDYAVTLALQLAYIMREQRLGLVVYDDYKVKHKIPASKDPKQIVKIARVLKSEHLHVNFLSAKTPGLSFKLSEKGFSFLRKILPIVKKRKSLSTGLIEVLGHVRSPAFLIFIVDITSHTSELVKIITNLKEKHRILLLTPNPILFYRKSNLNREVILKLYENYLKRKELIKKLNKIVPTIDLGPSDLLSMGVAE